jgi:predicted RNase H-like HicB family nuclease
MLRYTTLAPTPHLALHLRYKESNTPGVWIGFVHEVRGINVQSGSVEELFKDAVGAADIMLNRYKRDEAFTQLRAQGHDIEDQGQPIAFTLSDGEPLPSFF